MMYELASALPTLILGKTGQDLIRLWAGMTPLTNKMTYPKRIAVLTIITTNG